MIKVAKQYFDLYSEQFYVDDFAIYIAIEPKQGVNLLLNEPTIV